MSGVKLCDCGCGQPAPLSTRFRPDRGQIKGQPVRFVRGHAMRGRTATPETRAKRSAALKGRRLTPETRALMAAIAPRGPEHPRWKGDEIAYHHLHRWLGEIAVKSGSCFVCGASPPPYPSGRAGTEWANLSGQYRRDPSDFAEMCLPCHRRYDSERRKKAA